VPPPIDPPPVTVRTVGLTRFGWPRGEVVRRVARIVTPVMLNHWVTADPVLVQQVIPKWAVDQWGRLGLDPERLLARFAAVAAEAVGGPVPDVVAALTEPLAPKGWRAKLPDLQVASATADKLFALVGRPQLLVNKAPSKVDEALAAAADPAARDVAGDLTAVLRGLVEAPAYRVAGAEEAARQLLALFDRAGNWCKKEAKQAQDRAAAALDRMFGLAQGAAGGKKFTPAEFAEAVAAFPEAQFRHLCCLAAGRVYLVARDAVADELAQLTGFRQRLEPLQPDLAAAAEVPAGPPAPGDLLPPNTTTPEEAAQLFLKSLTDDDLSALDVRAQDGLERAFGGLYQACLNTATGADGLVKVLLEEARGYLHDRLGEVDLAGMLARRFGGGRGLADGLAWGHQAAAPALVSGGPWAKTEVTVFGCPAGAGGDPVRRQAGGVLPSRTPAVDTPDEVVIYRELPAVPLAALPQLGPSWAAAYQAAPEQLQTTPHTRSDVTRWVDVDAD
jgi:hypothetical protein